MTDTIKNELQIITNTITANTDAVAIYLFGSYAYGLVPTRKSVEPSL
ncbi:MAG: hypothetical protein Ta2F_08310 [Termitinemataceae bacterium]|nr:MAG: hypothetical protein Ta2F_08310 [Termitinemataceae bacterium]